MSDVSNLSAQNYLLYIVASPVVKMSHTYRHHLLGLLEPDYYYVPQYCTKPYDVVSTWKKLQPRSDQLIHSFIITKHIIQLYSYERVSLFSLFPVSSNQIKGSTAIQADNNLPFASEQPKIWYLFDVFSCCCQRQRQPSHHDWGLPVDQPCTVFSHPQLTKSLR